MVKERIIKKKDPTDLESTARCEYVDYITVDKNCKNLIRAFLCILCITKTILTQLHTDAKQA